VTCSATGKLFIYLQVHRDASVAALKAEADDQAAIIQVRRKLQLSLVFSLTNDT
jgi:hypothetical protein